MATTTIVPSKADPSGIFTLQKVFTTANAAASGLLVSSDIDVANKIGIFIGGHIGRTVTTAFTASTSVDGYVQAAVNTLGNDLWITVYAFSTGALAAGNTNAVTATNGAAGVGCSASGITMTANGATTYAATPAQLLYFRNNTTIANGEFHMARWAATNSTQLWITEDLARSQNSSDIFNGNYEIKCNINVEQFKRMRLVIENSSGVPVDVEAYCITEDSLVAT